MGYLYLYTGAERRHAHRRRQFDPEIAADLRPSADWSAVRKSMVAGGGEDAGSQRAYSLGSCAMGQTDGRLALFQNAPLGRRHDNCVNCELFVV